MSGAVPAAPREVDPVIGRVLDGRFTIEARLGAGSMGAVYRAKQHAMGRDVAIKILRSDRALDEGARARFLREARANSLLASPHTVTVFDFGQADNGDFFLAMELLEGESLGDRLKREKRIAPDAAVDAVRQALRSLAEAHAKGVIHRDLKPDNLFFAKTLTTDESGVRKHEETVKVVDFGIAKMLSDENSPMNAIETQAGTVFGTPRYMSPEQAQGKPLDARSDLYSLGVILYHMLTGRPPFTDDDAIVVMARHIKTAPKRPTEAAPQASIPQELENVLMRLLAKEPAQRPPSAEALSQELARAMNMSAIATSGIRVSFLPGAAPPPPSSTPASGLTVPASPSSVPAGFPPPVISSAAAIEAARQGSPNIPSAPLSEGSLSSLPSSTASLEVAAGVRPSKRRMALGAVVTALAVAAVVGVVARVVASRQAAEHAHTVLPAATQPAVAAPAIPPPPPAPAPPTPTSSIPQTSFNDLPRATPEAPPPPRATRPSPAPRATPRREPKPPPAPTGTASGHYGLFE